MNRPDPAATYRRRAVETASPVGLMVLLYQSATAGLRRGIAALETGDIEGRTMALSHVLGILAELKAALDFVRGGAIARQFQQFYELAERKVLEASCRQDPAPLRELVAPFQGIEAAWREVDSRPPESAVPTAAMTPGAPVPPDASAAPEEMSMRMRAGAIWQA